MIARAKILLCAFRAGEALLDSQLSHLKKTDPSTIEEAIQGHILAEAELVGTYQKSRR